MRARQGWVTLRPNILWEPPTTIKVSHLQVHAEHPHEALRGFRYVKATTDQLTGGNLHFVNPDNQRVEIFNECLVTRRLDIWQGWETARRDTVGQTFRQHASAGSFFTRNG